MTEDTDQPPASATDGEIPTADTPKAARKAAPRRKVTRASKETTAVLDQEPDAKEIDGNEDAAASTVKKPRRPRSKSMPVENNTVQDSAPQPVLMSAEAMERSPSPEAHVETQVIAPDAFRAVEQKAKQIFHPDGDASLVPAGPALHPATLAPAAPPPAAEPSPAPVASAAVAEEPIIGPSTAEIPPAPAAQPAPDGHRAPQPFQGRGEGRFDRQQGQGGGQNYGRHEGRQDRFDRRDNRQGQGYNDRPPQGQGGQFNRHPQQGGGNRPPQQTDGDRSQQQDGGDGGVSRVTEPQFAEGIVEVSGKGFGFLREPKRNFVQTPADVFVTPEVCRKYNLRDGQWIKGEVRRSSRGPQLFRLITLNGEDPEKFRNLPNFDELTSINPKKRIRLETTPERYTTRVMDLMTPVGKGQRGLIVAPPRTGKTTLLQHIGEAVIKNHPEMKLIILLVDERPEEVTEIRRSVPQAEIMASSNDSDLKSHVRIAQLAMERAKRLVEAGFDVFMLLDSITRMGRAFNNASAGGRTGSGGIDNRALEIPRKIFAAARNTEEAGSLTIMATALIETGSRGDEVIFLEFKGTGNMELVLDRKISDQRIFPAVDIFQSGTRREELLLQPWELDKINVIRRGLAGHKPLEAIERLLSFLKKFPTNAQMLTSLPG